ncbi:hypothetical protein [Mesorhizobium sp.]|nr:hypothetical protein [Mesorhizobium sp.]
MRDGDQTKRMDQDRQAYDDSANEQIEDHARKVENANSVFLAQNQTNR